MWWSSGWTIIKVNSIIKRIQKMSNTKKRVSWFDIRSTCILYFMREKEREVEKV